MRYKEKCDFLYEFIDLSDDIQFQLNTQIISKLSKDRSPFIRSLVAKLLFDYYNDFSKNILLELTNDKDNLVRVEAVDSLKAFIDHTVYFRLKHLAEFDPYYLVRAYSIVSLVYIGKTLDIDELSEFVLERLGKERYYINKILCYESLYLLGNKDSLNDLFDCFSSDNYRNKCAVINTLISILSIENYEAIHDFISNLNRYKFPVSVQSSLDNLSDEIDMIASSLSE
jgi:hypothetical protein